MLLISEATRTTLAYLLAASLSGELLLCIASDRDALGSAGIESSALCAGRSLQVHLDDAWQPPDK